MNKVYILIKSVGIPHHERRIIGAVSTEYVANRWKDMKTPTDEVNYWIKCVVDDPELLNRIAKESENKK